MNVTAVMKTSIEAIRNKKSVTISSGNTGQDQSRRHHSTPLISRVYQARMAGMTKFIESAIHSIEYVLGGNKGCHQILALGCGHDTSYSLHCARRTILVDFEEVIQSRREAQTGETCYTGCGTEHFVAADLRDPEGLLGKLMGETDLQPLEPTIVILESVLSYIDRDKVQALLTLLHRELSCCLTLIYDPLLALSGSQLAFSSRQQALSRAMELTFDSRHVPLRFACGTPAEMMTFLHSCHFEQVLCMSMSQILTNCFSSVPSEQCEASRRGDGDHSCSDVSHMAPSSATVPFDEFASLAALHRVYSISCACNSEALFDKFTENLFTHSSSGSKEKYIGRKKWHATDSLYGVRCATAADANVMAAMFSECHADFVVKYTSVRAHIKNSTQLIHDTLQENGSKCQQVRRHFFVAEELSTHTGCVAFSYSNKATDGRDHDFRGQLSHLCVDKTVRKRGLGSLLVTRVVDQASSDPLCAALELTTLADMTEARQLYRVNNFVENGISTIGQNCQLVHMTLSLQK